MSVVEAVKAVIGFPPVWQVLIIGFGFSLVVSIVAVWFERKSAARVQRRLGPYWASPRLGGLLHLVADMLRYAFQQVIIPRTVDTVPFLVAPIVGMVIAILPVAVVPFTSNPQYWPLPPAAMEYSLLIALAITTLPPIFIVAAGWASNNKFAVIGGLREAFIITAYELIAILGFLAAAAMVGSFNLAVIAEAQSPIKWFMFLNPFAFLAVIIAVAMSTSAFPFEIPESESEVVAGPFTEYSGLLYALNMGGAYMRRFIYGILIALAFMGGWAPYTPGEGLLAGYIIPSIIVVVKATIVVLAISFLRAIYGRYRLDQALDIAWRLTLPLALLGLAVGIILSFIGVA